jgi:hypothetical protein
VCGCLYVRGRLSLFVRPNGRSLMLSNSLYVCMYALQSITTPLSSVSGQCAGTESYLGQNPDVYCISKLCLHVHVSDFRIVRNERDVVRQMASGQPQLTVVVPAYNETPNIRPLTERLFKATRTAGMLVGVRSLSDCNHRPKT